MQTQALLCSTFSSALKLRLYFRYICTQMNVNKDSNPRLHHSQTSSYWNFSCIKRIGTFSDTLMYINIAKGNVQYIMEFKKTCSRDGLDIHWHAWVELGPSMDRSRLFKFWKCSSIRTKYFYISCEPRPACLGSWRVLGQNYLASYCSGQQALASHWLEKFANSTPA